MSETYKQDKSMSEAVRQVRFALGYTNIESENDLFKRLWKVVKGWFWVCGKEVWYVDEYNDIAQRTSLSHALRIIKSSFEVEFRNIEHQNKNRKRSDKISIPKVLEAIANRIIYRNRLSEVNHMTATSRFSYLSYSKLPVLNTNTTPPGKVTLSSKKVTNTAKTYYRN